MSDTRWLVLLCASRVGFSLIFTVYSALLPVLMGAWLMSAADAGLVQSGWHVGYLLSLFGAGLLTDRLGARRTFLSMSAGACASALLFAFFANGFWSGLLLYFVAGLASGGSYTPVLALIAQRYGPEKRGSAMGWFLAAGSFGYGVSLIACAAIAPWAGWRAGLALSAVATIAGATLGWLAMRDTRDESPHASTTLPWLASARQLWRNKPAKLAIGSYTLHCWELLGMWAWLPAFLVAAAAHGGDLSSALAVGVGIAGMTHLVSAVGSIAGGTLSDRIGRTRVILMMSLASLACSFSFGWMLGSTFWLIAMVAIIYNLTAIGDSSVFSTVLTETVPPSQIGFAFSVRSVLGFGMGAISPWVFGLVLDWVGAGDPGLQAWGLAWCTIGIGALLGPLLTWQLHRSLAQVNSRSPAKFDA
ncbi:MAG TPA: MFS transporter [Burkholderiaceae bacterium]|nr:MFS transporter [Burkholderiaceae bacterium]